MRNNKLPQAMCSGLIFGSVSIIIYAVRENSMAVLGCYLLFGSIGLAITGPSGKTASQIYLCVYGFASTAAVVLAFIFASYYGVPYWGGGSDELEYERIGLEYATNYHILEYAAIRGSLVQEWHNSVGYIYLVGLLAKLSDVLDGFHTMVPRLFNAACLSLLCVVQYSMAMRLGMQRNYAVIVAMFTGFFPLMMWTSVQTLRDIVQALLITLLVFLWLPDRTGSRRYSIPVLVIISLALIIPIIEMRRAQALIAGIFVFVSILSTRRVTSLLHRALVTLLLVLTALYFSVDIAQTIQVDVTDAIAGIGTYAEMRGQGLSGGGGGLSRVVFETPLFPIGWLYRTAYALISPIPVEFVPVDLTWLSIGTIVQILCLPFLWAGIRVALNRPVWRQVLLVFTLLFCGMAMFTFTIRHMTQFLPFGILLAALGWETYQGNKSAVLATMAAVGVCLFALYLSLKIF